VPHRRHVQWLLEGHAAGSCFCSTRARTCIALCVCARATMAGDVPDTFVCLCR
jgi:hypothetical protein